MPPEKSEDKTVSENSSANLDLYTGEDPPLPDLSPSLPRTPPVRTGPDRTTHPDLPSLSLRESGAVLSVRIRRDQKDWLKAAGFEMGEPVRDLIDVLMGRTRELVLIKNAQTNFRVDTFRKLHEISVQRERLRREIEEGGRAAVEKEVAELKVEYEKVRDRFLKAEGRFPRVRAREWIHEQKSWYRLLRNQHDVDLLQLMEAP